MFLFAISAPCRLADWTTFKSKISETGFLEFSQSFNCGLFYFNVERGSRDHEEKEPLAQGTQSEGKGFVQLTSS
jgi:hypothetical protein